MGAAAFDRIGHRFNNYRDIGPSLLALGYYVNDVPTLLIFK
jgi:hypothetical protein